MKVKDIMSDKPACCTRDATLQEVARLMVDCDCGVIPIVDSNESRRLLGVITDRDIVCRTIAKGINPLNQKAGDYMSSPVVVANPETDLHECCENMERYQIRRAIVVDENGKCCGVLSQADIVERGPERESTEILREVSKPTTSSSKVQQQGL